MEKIRPVCFEILSEGTENSGSEPAELSFVQLDGDFLDRTKKVSNRGIVRASWNRVKP